MKRNEIYNPKADAQKDIDTLIAQARIGNKNIIIQAGGNWCVWCLRFYKFITNNFELKKIIDANYIYYHLNFSLENENEKVFEQYGNPGDEFGFPVLIILDKNGEKIHIQRTDVFEEDNGYNLIKVKNFLTKWSTNTDSKNTSP